MKDYHPALSSYRSIVGVPVLAFRNLRSRVSAIWNCHSTPIGVIIMTKNMISQLFALITLTFVLIACGSKSFPSARYGVIEDRTTVSPNLENQMSLVPPLTRLVVPTATYMPTTRPIRTPKESGRGGDGAMGRQRPTKRATLTRLPTRTPTKRATSTPLPTPTATSTPLVTSNPSDEEVVRLLLDGRDSEYFEYVREELAAGRMSYEFTRQDVDLNGDRQPEILLYGYDDGLGLFPYASILGRTNGVWQPWLYTGNVMSSRCAEVRATVEQQRVLVDFLDCGPSATNQFYLTWEQRWIQCGENTCTVVWSAPLLRMSQFGTWSDTHQYAVGELMTPDSNTIQLTTRRFGLIDVPSEWGPPDTVDIARRVVGPHTVDIFKWDGTAYQLEERTQIAPGIEIAREFDLESRETIRLVDWILDHEAFANFWGLSSAKEANGAENERWGTLYAAAHNGSPGELGEWVAGIIGANDQPLCRLTIQQYNGQEFSLFSRRELPCTVNFTRLAWADITGDSQDELLLLTISPDRASVQRLHIYAVEGELVELATVTGHLNGPDGVNIRWEDNDHDGTIDEIVAGLPLTSYETHTFAEFTPHPRFRVYRWDAAQQTLIAGEIRP